MVVAPLRRRRVSDKISEAEKPPGKTGRFLFRLAMAR
jgi:hypothetical protein